MRRYRRAVRCSARPVAYARPVRAALVASGLVLAGALTAGCQADSQTGADDPSAAVSSPGASSTAGSPATSGASSLPAPSPAPERPTATGTSGTPSGSVTSAAPDTSSTAAPATTTPPAPSTSPAAIVASSARSSAAAAPAGAVKPVTDACSLLAPADVTELLGVDSAEPSPTGRGSILSCRYDVAVGASNGRFYIDISTGRGHDLYQQTLGSGGFESVSGVADGAAYNGEDGRFAVRDGDAYLLLTLPVALGGSSVATKGAAAQVGAATARKVLAAMR